jgi:hypothetical protein
MNEANRKLWMEAQDAMRKLERGLTAEIHDKEAKLPVQKRMRLAVEYGGVAAAQAALDTVG